MAIAVLIPYRGDGGQRDRLFAHVLKAWRPTPVFVGLDPSDRPFNAARAFNHAFRQAQDWDHKITGVVMFGADHLPDHGGLRYAESLLAHQEWAALFTRTGTYGRYETDLILAGADPGPLPFEVEYDFCTAILAVRADVWLELGGMDERFEGWGCEDTAFRCALQTLYPERDRPIGTLRHLWHEPAPRSSMPYNVRLIHSEYEPAAGDPVAMRAVLERAKAARSGTP